MKKFLSVAAAFCFSIVLFSQENPSTSSKKKKTWATPAGRANDHFMIQYGYMGWINTPDSVNTKGFSRSFNAYIMYDLPFKTDPRISVALGAGIGTDHMFFEKTHITIENHLREEIQFLDVSDTNHFDKYKLAIAYFDFPLEFRYVFNPENTNKSFKVALGFKVGILMDAHTKGKEWVNKNGAVIPGYDDNYIQKNKDKTFFYGNRFAGTIRFGYGFLTAFGTYQVSSVIRENLGPRVKPWTIGLTLSGL
jgi:hypothetical protein